jgi:hypothetical protein
VPNQPMKKFSSAPIGGLSAILIFIVICLLIGKYNPGTRTDASTKSKMAVSSSK